MLLKFVIFKSVKMWLFRDSQLNSNGKLQVQTSHRKSRIRYGYVRIWTFSLVARSTQSRRNTWKCGYFITLSLIFVSASRHQKRSKSDPISWIRVRTRPAWIRSRTCTETRIRTRNWIRARAKTRTWTPTRCSTRSRTLSLAELPLCCFSGNF